MIVIKGRAMLVDTAGNVTWVQLPSDPRQKQAARYQLESAQLSSFSTKALADAVGCEILNEIQIERLIAVPFHQDMSAMYSALARDKML